MNELEIAAQYSYNSRGAQRANQRRQERRQARLAAERPYGSTENGYGGDYRR